MQKPKPDQRLFAAINRLRSNFDFIAVVKFMQEDYEYLKESMIACELSAMPSMQGRAAALRDVLEMFTKEHPK